MYSLHHPFHMQGIRTQIDLLPTSQGFKAQLAEQYTGIVEVMGSIPVVAMIFFSGYKSI